MSIDIYKTLDIKMDIPETEDIFSFQKKEQMILNISNELKDIIKDELWELLVVKKYDGPTLRLRLKYKIDDNGE